MPSNHLHSWSQATSCLRRIPSRVAQRLLCGLFRNGDTGDEGVSHRRGKRSQLCASSVFRIWDISKILSLA